MSADVVGPLAGSGTTTEPSSAAERAMRAELDIMAHCHNALVTLDADARGRVLRWLNDGAFPAATSPDPWNSEPPF